MNCRSTFTFRKRKVRGIARLMLNACFVFSITVGELSSRALRRSISLTASVSLQNVRSCDLRELLSKPLEAAQSQIVSSQQSNRALNAICVRRSDKPVRVCDTCFSKIAPSYLQKQKPTDPLVSPSAGYLETVSAVGNKQ